MSGVPESPLFTDCYEGFEPQATPRADVARLSMVCGPSTGLLPFAKTSGTVDEGESHAVFQWDAERGDCFRIFAVAAAPVADLEVEIAWPHRTAVSVTNENRRWAVVAENHPFCAPEAGTFEARFSTHAGRGEFAASVWRGEHMRQRRPYRAPASSPTG